MNNYNQPLPATTTNAPQAEYKPINLAQVNVDFSSAVISALSSLQHQVRWSSSQIDREAMYSIGSKLISDAPFYPELKQQWQAELTTAYMQGCTVPVVTVHEQIAGARVKMVNPLVNQPRVETDAKGRAVIRTINQFMEESI